MIKREELNKVALESVNEVFQSDVDVYKINTDEINSLEELQGKEKEIFELQDEYSKYLEGVSYNLPKNVKFEDIEYPAKEVFKRVIVFLNKLEVEWRYTLGLHQMVKLLNQKNLKSLTYTEYDSLLRTLNQIKFKGDSEWTDILIVNDYFAQCQEDFMKDASYVVYLSSLHNVLLDRMKALDPGSVEETDTTQAQE